jgi:hypothetical protein
VGKPNALGALTANFTCSATLAVGLQLRSSLESSNGVSAFATAREKGCKSRRRGRFGSALADLHGLAPEVVAVRSAQPMVGEQLDRDRRAYPPPPYSPTALAAFSVFVPVAAAKGARRTLIRAAMRAMSARILLGVPLRSTVVTSRRFPA